MKPRLDMAKIAKALGAERTGKVRATGGYFGALGLVAEIEERFHVPEGGGRATDPALTEKRLVSMSEPTLHRLEEIATRISESRSQPLGPMQVASLLIEKGIHEIGDAAGELLPPAPKRAKPRPQHRAKASVRHR